MIDPNIRARLTPEFLATLVELANQDGNGGDWPATRDFVRSAFDVAGKEYPSDDVLRPYSPDEMTAAGLWPIIETNE